MSYSALVVTATALAEVIKMVRQRAQTTRFLYMLMLWCKGSVGLSIREHGEDIQGLTRERDGDISFSFIPLWDGERIEREDEVQLGGERVVVFIDAFLMCPAPRRRQRRKQKVVRCDETRKVSSSFHWSSRTVEIPQRRYISRKKVEGDCRAILWITMI